MGNDAERYEVLIAKDGSCMIFVSTPRECPVCHVMRGILINRDGKTRCWDCDGAYREGMAAGRINNPVIGRSDDRANSGTAKPGLSAITEMGNGDWSEIFES